MKSRTTVNNVIISYDEETDELRFEEKGVVLALKMGEDNLNLLYIMTPYVRYKKYVMIKQDFRCKECGKDLRGISANKYALHHDPRLGSTGARYIDFKDLTRNRILCNDCHRQLRNGSH
jgi:hypothetical protein